jgi:hypothetical protein
LLAAGGGFVLNEERQCDSLTGMSNERFTELLRHFTRHEPFIPFVVEMNDGRRLIIDSPAVAFAEGGAGYLSDEDGLVDFSADQVRAITHLTPETTV